ncbi:MAG TPA: hypothetical protein VF787_04100 [Thermoanaerobaculia bacterium]
MPTVTHLPRLQQSLADLDEALAELALLAGDVPEPDDEPAIADAMRERVAIIRGDVAESTATLRDRDARAALSACHERFNAIARRMSGELATRAHVVEIVSIASDRGGAWTKWSDAMQQGLDRCAVAHDAVAASLLECWRGLAAPQLRPRLGRRSHV